ncbi:hypothetical protein ACA910_016649 [Epithemia clementina (nom. ined.)]
MSSISNRNAMQSKSLFQEIFPKLRPFQKEALEFATKGTPYRNFHKNDDDKTVENRKNKATLAPSFEDAPVRGVGRILLGDEMGLGKTVTALAIASYYYEQDPSEWPLLIFCPASLRYTWPSEMEKFWPSLPPSAVHVVVGFSDVSWMEKVASGQVKVVILTYSLMQNRSAVAQCLLQHVFDRNKKAKRNQKNSPTNSAKSPPRKQQRTSDDTKTGSSAGGVYFPTIIADESHNLKQREAQRTKMILPLLQESKRLLLLSGTPALARPVELHTQVQALAPSLFGNFNEFANRYCAPKKTWVIYGGGRRFPRWDYSGASNLDELHAKLKNVMVRRLKQDVLEELPPKQRSIIPVTMSSDFCSDCRQAMKAVQDNRESSEPDEHSFDTKSVLMQAYQATGLGKAAAITEYLMDWLEGSTMTDKIVVFAHHTKVLDTIQAALHRKASSTTSKRSQHQQQTYHHIRIDGQVPTSERHTLVRQFQSQPQTRVALLSMTAAGVGLTLTAASTVLFGELHWTPGVLAQAEDRVHRLGQTKISQIVYCLCQDEKLSLDPTLCRMLGHKMNTLLQVVDGGASGKSNFLAHAPNKIGGLNENGTAAGQEQGRSGTEEVTDFFANLNQSQPKRPAVRGSIESFFSKSTATPLGSTRENRSQISSSVPSSFSEMNVAAASVKPQQDLHNSWTCDTCTFAENHNQRCDVCNKPQVLESSQESVMAVGRTFMSANQKVDSVVEWSCSSCTFVNSKYRSADEVYQCEMCGHSYSRWAPNESHDSSKSSSLVTPTSSNKRAKPLTESTIIIDLDSDNESQTSARSPDVVEILDGPSRESKQKANVDCGKGHDWVFAVSKNSGRITIHRREPETSTNINFDVDQVLSAESSEDLDARQARSVHRKTIPITFSDKGLEAIVQQVQKSSGIGTSETPKLVLEIKAFVTSFLRLRAVEQQTIKDAGRPFPPVHLSQAVAATSMRGCLESSQRSVERYSGGVKERAYEKRENGIALNQEEQDVLDGKACSWCGNTLSRGHQKADAVYCTQECAEEGRLRRGGKFASKQIRTAVFALEGGKCTLCGIDAHTLYEQILCLQPAERLNRLLDANWKLPRTGKRVENLLQNPKEGDFWQVDHIQAVAEGGGSCGLDNLRTLCVPCHQRETEKLRSRLKLYDVGITATNEKESAATAGSSRKKRKQVDIRSAFSGLKRRDQNGV